MLRSGLVSRVGALHRVNLIAPFQEKLLWLWIRDPLQDTNLKQIVSLIIYHLVICFNIRYRLPKYASCGVSYDFISP